MAFRHPWSPFITATLAGLILSAGLSSCVVSTSGDITFMGEQEAMAQSDVKPIYDTDGIAFEIHRLARAQMYLLRVPAGASLSVEPAVTDRLAKLPAFAQDADVVAVINGGFFDPKNELTTSHVIRNGSVLLDPNQNLDLMTNANVASYMGQILNRSEFRRYSCNGVDRYDIAFHDGPVPAGCDRQDALGAGPQLLPNMTHQPEAFWDVVDGKVLRNPIGMTAPNARSAIGIAADGSILMAMAAQQPPMPNASDPWRSGVTLQEMADFLKAQGAVQALNLDGGSSSALFYNGRTYYGRLNAEGETVQRSVKSVLVVRRK